MSRSAVLSAGVWFLAFLSFWVPFCRVGNTVAAEPDVSLRMPPTSGEPGEEIAVEFRATFAQPVLIAVIQFELSEDVVRFVRTDVEGTASAHVAPRGIFYEPDFFRGGFLTGVRFDTQTQYGSIEPGDDLIVVKAILEVRADAAPGDYAVRVLSAQFSNNGTMSVEVEGDGLLQVEAPTRPRPVRDLSCQQSGSAVRLSWSPTGVYDAVAVLRDGETIATLPASRQSYTDAPDPGPVSYAVVASRVGNASLPASCEILVQEERPEAVRDLACAQSEGAARLDWTNGSDYDLIEIFRNSRLVARLDGSAESYVEPWTSDLLTVYTVRGLVASVETLPASCRLHELSDRFVVWAEDVRVQPGMTNVPVRLFGTNPATASSIQLAIRIDPSFVSIRELTVDGTTVEAARYDQFLYQAHVMHTGEVAMGIYFDTVPPFGFPFPAGADQHLVTVLVDISPDAPDGTVVPVEVGEFGNPALLNLFTVDGQSMHTENQPGGILVGSSPVPEVRGLRAESPEEEEPPPAPGAGVGAAVEAGILLSWRNSGEYSAVAIERDGLEIAVLPGEQTSLLDAEPGPGAHRYRVFARVGEKQSFPASTTSHPRNVPGTFLRGDANADRRVNLADAVRVLDYLFRRGSPMGCLDAADADDSGGLDLADGLTILHYLFRSAGPLPAPGTQRAWFDPTPDGLPCE